MSSINQGRSYKGFEVYSNSFSMVLKMLKNTIFWFIVFHFILVSYLIYQKDRKEPIITHIFSNASKCSSALGDLAIEKTLSTIQYFIPIDLKFKEYILGANKQKFKFYLNNTKNYIRPFFRKAAYLWFLFPLILYAYRSKSRQDHAERIVKGSGILRGWELKLKMLIKFHIPKRLKLGSLCLEKRSEPLGTLLVGSPGSGKTVAMTQIAKSCIKENFPCIFLDFNKGDYIPLFYQKKDIIFNPADSGCVKWTIFNDIETEMDIDRISNVIYPDVKNQNPIWSSTARAVFEGCLKYLIQNNRTTNKHIYDFLNLRKKKMILKLKSFPGGMQGAILLNKDKTGDSIHANLLSKFKHFEFLRDLDGDFSIKNWVSEIDSSKKDFPNIFISTKAELKNVIKPITTTFLELLFLNILSLEESKDRRIFFFLDEFPQLFPVPSLKDALNTGRSKGLAAYIGIQGFSQVRGTYGQDNAQSIINACASKIYLRTEGADDADKLSKDIGMVEVVSANSNTTWGKLDGRDGGSMSATINTKQLVLPSEIQQLKSSKKGCHGYIKLPNYQWSQIKLKPKNIDPPENAREFFILREELKLGNVKNILNKANNTNDPTGESSDKTTPSLKKDTINSRKETKDILESIQVENKMTQTIKEITQKNIQATTEQGSISNKSSTKNGSDYPALEH